MTTFTLTTSLWLDILAALFYWWVFVAREFLRYYEPTGLKFPRYWERRPPLFRVPWKTHYIGITAVVFTWALAAKYYQVHGAALGWTVALLLLYFFFALWNGPQLQVVSTIEGIFQMAVAINLALYLTVHNWSFWWFLLMDISLWVMFATEWVYLLKRTAQFARRQPHHPTNNRSHFD